MTEKDIIALLGKKRRYETEIAIMRDCSDDLLDSEQSQRSGDYALLKSYGKITAIPLLSKKQRACSSA